ncbi:MAG: hypothetical protein A2Z32_14475 [Chloroflexi bacterium RBG_16_69_14]|nr:MAG: hypothetical protein A2Z32_14475 [Chloroflexi bacterium RBG_16_69_14]
MIASSVSWTSRRSPAAMASARRASLGTTIWCLVLTLTLSMDRMLSDATLDVDGLEALDRASGY